MFDFGLGSFELLMIAIVAIIVVGPKDLPKMLRTVGKFMTKVRGMAREFQGYLDDAARETGLDDVKKEVGKMTNFDVSEMDTKPGISETAGSSAVATPKKSEKSKPAAASKLKKPAKPKPASASKTAASKTQKPAKKSSGSKPKKTKQDA